MANRFINPVSQFFDSASEVYSGGKLHFYLTGTSTPANTYSDSTLTTANANPIVLDSAGRLPDDVFLDPSITYKVMLKDSSDVEVWSRDPVVDPAANVSAAFRVYNADPNGNLAGSAGSVGGSSASVVFDIASNLLWVCTTTGTASTAVWTQIGATLSGAVTLSSVITPSSLAADQDDYTPTSFSTAAIIRQNASADVKITGLDAAASAGRIVLFQNVATSNSITLIDESADSTAANRFSLQGDLLLEPDQSAFLWYDATSARWRAVGTGGGALGMEPGGRLTISTDEPIITSDVTAATTVYYAPYAHNYAKLWNGSSWYTVQFSELSQTLADTTKSPAAASSGNVYDMFLWNDAGTLRCTRGPAWDSSTSRGTGAGTTQLERKDSVRTNRYDITNGPTANMGLYVGTIQTDSSNQMNVMLYPTAAAGGTANRIDVWNAFNRMPITSVCRDSTNTWEYTTATFRRMNNSAGNRITVVSGLIEDPISIDVLMHAISSGAGYAVYAGIGVDSTSTASGLIGAIPAISATRPSMVRAQYSGLVGLGTRYFQALEASEAAGTTTWSGDNATPDFLQSGMQALWRY